MSAPLRQTGKLLALIDKVISEKAETPVRQPQKRRPRNIGAVQTDGPYLVHAAPDLDRQDPAPDLASSDNRTHDVNDEIIADAYRRGLRVRFRKKIVRRSLGFLFGEG